MKNDYSYKLKQVQKLAMTNEMQLSIKILQMSTEELNEFVEQEFVDNPIIEINEDAPINVREFDFNISKRNYNNDSEESPFNFMCRDKSLKDYLHEQILESEDDNIIRKTAEYIVECLDENGYFKLEIEEVAKALKVENIIVKKALSLVQELEPCGVGARNLKECLLIQIKQLNIDSKVLIGIINNNLSDIGNDNYKKISIDQNITRSEAQRYANIIKKLEPRPSRGFYTGEDYRYITPEAAIIKNGGSLEILMNEQASPRLVVSSTYKRLINEKKDKDIETESYVKEKLARAEFIIKSIEERRCTLKKILEYIVNKQYNYFWGTEKFLKPMTIKEISENLSCSDSTVSRAVKDKYILMDLGIVKLKNLFSLNTIKSDKDISVTFIKDKIERIISEEDKKKPISDQEIADVLKKINIQISRRTVAKYREEIGIKSSHKRKIL